MDDEQAIRKLVYDWIRATKNGNIGRVLDLMTDDVVFMVPGQEPFGKEAFESFASSEGMDDSKFEGKSEIKELKILGDWAYMRTYLEVKTTPPYGKPTKKSGYTLTILRKEHGEWKLARDANLLTTE